MDVFLSRLKKTLQKRSFMALLIALNKTSLRYVVKFFVSLPFLFYVLRRKKLARSLLLSDREKLSLQQLQQEGYTPITDICSPLLLEAVQKMALEKAAAARLAAPVQKNSKKEFWVRLLDEEMFSDRWTSDNPFIQLSLQEPVLKILAGYFKNVPYLNSVFLSLSVFDPAEFRHSQLWHQDRDDTRVVKLFAYLTDVPGAEHGPFTYLNKNSSKKVKNSFVPLHLRDDQLGPNVSEKDFIPVLAPACSVFMVDTSRCYHMGNRVYPGNERLLYTASFITAPPIYANFDNHIRPQLRLTELQKKSIEFAYRNAP